MTAMIVGERGDSTPLIIVSQEVKLLWAMLRARACVCAMDMWAHHPRHDFEAAGEESVASRREERVIDGGTAIRHVRASERGVKNGNSISVFLHRGVSQNIFPLSGEMA